MSEFRGIRRGYLVLFILLGFAARLFAAEGVENWVVETEGNVYSSPAIGADGTVYVGSDDKKVYAVDPDGSVSPSGVLLPTWSFETGNRVYSSPVVDVDGDGTVYIGSHDFNLYAINPNGTQKWTFATGNWVESSPALGTDGTIYVGSWDGNLYAVNPDGSEKWRFATNGYIKSSPVVGPDGTIYVGSDDHYVYAIDENGTQKWRFLTENRVRSSAAIGADGTVYIGSDDKKVYAIDSNGTERWRFSTGGFVYSSPAVDIDGTVYVGSDDKKVYAIDSNGVKKWEVATGGFVYSSPVIGSDGIIYVGSNDFRLYAIDQNGGVLGSYSTNGYVWSSPVIGADGSVYVGSGDGGLYAITWTADTTPPTVASTNPVDNAVNIGVNTAISVNFSEVMDTATITNVTFSVRDNNGPIAGEVSYGGTTATFSPVSNLAYESTCTATITAEATDLAGNPLNSTYSWSFTTGVFTGPVIAVSPGGLSQSCQGGTNATGQDFALYNSGGGVLSYAISDDASWMVCAPDSGTSTGDANTVTVTYTTEALASGVYEGNITITAPNANNSPVTIPVTMTVTSHPPEADAGPDQIVEENSDVWLDGSASSDPENDIASYHWAQIGGSPTVMLVSDDTAEARFTAPDVHSTGAALTFELTVTDGDGLQDKETCVVNVSGDNDPPQAVCGPNLTVGEEEVVLLNGINSRDPEGDLISYRWTQIDGPLTVVMAGQDLVEAAFTAPNVGPGGMSLEFKLTVTDGEGLQGTDTCIVNVTGDNDPPTANAGDDQTVYEQNVVTLDGAMSQDPDDTIATYRWEQVGGNPTVTLSDANTASASFTAPNIVAGGVALTFQLTVSDEHGLQATDTSIVNITWTNDAPTAHAGADQMVYEGDSVILDGTGSTDSDDGIASFLWEQVGGTPTVALSNADAAQADFEALESGILTFQLTVTDLGGLKNADSCTITVHALPVSAPSTESSTSDDGGGSGGGGGGGCFISTMTGLF